MVKDQIAVAIAHLDAALELARTNEGGVAAHEDAFLAIIRKIESYLTSKTDGIKEAVNAPTPARVIKSANKGAGNGTA